MAMWTILALSKLFVVIPVWSLNDRVNVKYLLLLGKILYLVCWILFFLAWMFVKWELLLMAIVFCGFASGITFTTYHSLYAKYSNKSNHTQIFGMYFSSYQIAQIVWAMISAVLVRYLDLPYMYFFVIIFALISLLQDDTLRLFIAKHRTRSWNTFYKKAIRSYQMEIENWRHDAQLILGEHWFIQIFKKEVFSIHSRRKIWEFLKKSSHSMYMALWSVCLTYLLNYVGFLFIPIIAVANNLNLSQIAIVYAVMKLPYLIMVFFGKFIDKYNKKLIIGLILIFMSLFYILLWFQDSFAIILVLTFAISLWIAFMNPISAGLVSDYAHKDNQWMVSGMTNFAWKIGEIAGSLWIGLLVVLAGIQVSFILVGIATFVLGMRIFLKKFISKNILIHSFK